MHQTIYDIVLGDVTTSNNSVQASTAVNVMTNESSSDDGGGGGDANVSLNLYQTNTGDVTSAVSNVDMSMTANADKADDITHTGDMSVANNDVGASSLANAINTDFVHSVNGGGGKDYGSDISSYQTNTGDVSASVTGVNMAMHITGTIQSNNVGVRNNTIRASAVANSISNIIRMR